MSSINEKKCAVEQKAISTLNNMSEKTLGAKKVVIYKLSSVFFFFPSVICVAD